MDETSSGNVVGNLKNLPDIVLVDQIKNGSEQSLQILGDRHSGLYISTVSRITGNSIPNLREDLLNDKFLVLFNASQSYDPTKGTSFSTHFANETKWHCLKSKSKKHHAEISCENDFIDSLLDSSDKFHTDDHDHDGMTRDGLLLEIEKLPDERAKKILMLRYFSREDKNIPWKKIADQVQLSTQGCINIHDKWIAIIRKNIEKHNKEIRI